MRPGSADTQPPRLELVEITKRFGSFVANENGHGLLRRGHRAPNRESHGPGQGQRSHYSGHGNDDDWRTAPGKADPCMGLDFGAVDFIHSQLLEARNRNVAILLLSEDLDELVALSDRLVGMAAGKIVYSAPIDEIDRQLIGEKMASH